MKSFFRELCTYSNHCNRELISILAKDNSAFPERSLKLLNHILNAQNIWNNRIEKNSESFGVWEMHEIPDLEKIEQLNYDRSLRLVDIGDFDRKVTYVNSQGKTYSNTVRDILFHVINHGTHHRAQI